MMAWLRATPNPMYYTREVKRRAFVEGKAVFSNHYCDFYLANFEKVETGKRDSENSKLWSGHPDEFKRAG